MHQNTTRIPGSNVYGHIAVWQINDATGQKILVGRQPNQIQYSWGYIAAKQIGYRPQPDRYNYNISAIYIEFENQADPEIEIAASAFDRDLGVTYYNALVDSATRDFLRIPLTIEPTGNTVPGFEANLPLEQQINKLTFFVQTAGTAGVHGKTFSHTVNSKVYAAALVAAPVFGDRTKDVVFARTIFAPANQVTKEASSQIGITWDISFI
jgi:hypothetical protein